MPLRLLIICIFNVHYAFQVSDFENARVVVKPLDCSGTPAVTCSRKSISLFFETNLPFQGRVSTVNKLFVPECNEDYSSKIQQNASFTLDISRCTDTIFLVNGSRVLTAHVEIGFHPLVITNNDRIFVVECIDNTPAPVFQVLDNLNCTHLVRMAAKWESVTEFRLGDSIVHEWSCTLPQKELGKTQMFLTNCNAVSQSGSIIHLIDENGCIIDSELMGDVVYNSYVPKLYARAKIFKLLTNEKYRIECSLEFCKQSSDCSERAFPPKCAFTKEEIMKRYMENRTIDPETAQQGNPNVGYDQKIRISTNWLTVNHNQYTNIETLHDRYHILTTMDPNIQPNQTPPSDHFLMAISHRDPEETGKRKKESEPKVEAVRILRPSFQPILSPAIDSDEEFIESITLSNRADPGESRDISQGLNLVSLVERKPTISLPMRTTVRHLMSTTSESAVTSSTTATTSTTTPTVTSTSPSTTTTPPTTTPKPTTVALVKPWLRRNNLLEKRKKAKTSGSVSESVSSVNISGKHLHVAPPRNLQAASYFASKSQMGSLKLPAKMKFYTDIGVSNAQLTTPTARSLAAKSSPVVGEATTDLPFNIEETTFTQLNFEEMNRKPHGRRMNGVDWRLDEAAINDTEVSPQKQVACANTTIISSHQLCRWSGVEHLLLIWSFASMLVWIVMIAVCFYRHSTRKPRWMAFREQELRRATQTRVLQHEHPWLHADAFEERNRGKKEVDLNKF